MITNAELHSTILKYILQHGFAPDTSILSRLLNSSKKAVVAALNNLADAHGVVLHPNSSKIWVIHPFSLAPTNFLVQTATRSWWGNCAWCSLGVAALLKEDVTILTNYGAHGKPLKIEIKNGEIFPKNLVVHFPIAMKNAWDNVIYTCSTMLIFSDKTAVSDWSDQHQISMGDVQPISKIWNFSKKWYGNHLAVDWEKWTIQEAKAIFQEYELTHKVWQLDDSNERF